MNTRDDCCCIKFFGKSDDLSMNNLDQVLFDFHQREKNISKVCTVNNIKLQNSVSVSENNFSDFCIFLGFCSLCTECSRKNTRLNRGEAPVVTSEELLHHNSHTSTFLNLLAELHSLEAVAFCNIEINFKSSIFDILKKNPPRPNSLFQEPLSLSCTVLPISKSKATVWITVKDADILFRSLSKPSNIKVGQESNEITASLVDENSFMSSSQDSTSTLSTATGIVTSSRVPATTTVISSLSTRNTRGKKNFAQRMQTSSNSNNRKKGDSQFRASIRILPITTEPLIDDKILDQTRKSSNHEVPNQSHDHDETTAIADASTSLQVPWISHLIARDNNSSNTSSTIDNILTGDDNNTEHDTGRSGSGSGLHNAHSNTTSMQLETVTKDTTGYLGNVDEDNSTITTSFPSIEYLQNQELNDALLKDIDNLISESNLPTDVKHYMNECIRLSGHPPLSAAWQVASILVPPTNPTDALGGDSLSKDSLGPVIDIVTDADTLSKKKNEKSLSAKSNKRKYQSSDTNNTNNNIRILEQLHMLCTQIRTLITKSKASSLTIELVVAASCLLQLLLPLEIDTILNSQRNTKGEGEADKASVAIIHAKKKSKPPGGDRPLHPKQSVPLFSSKSTLKSVRIAKDKLVLLFSNSLFLSLTSSASVAARDWLFYSEITIPTNPFNIGSYTGVTRSHSQNHPLQMKSSFPILQSSFRHLLVSRYQNSLMVDELLDGFLIEDESSLPPPSDEAPEMSNDTMYFSRHHDISSMTNQISFTTKTAAAAASALSAVAPSQLETDSARDNLTTNLVQLSSLQNGSITVTENNSVVNPQENIHTTERFHDNNTAAVAASEPTTTIAVSDSSKPSAAANIRRPNPLIGQRPLVLPRSEVTRPSKTFVRTSSLREPPPQDGSNLRMASLRQDGNLDSAAGGNSFTNQRKLQRRSSSITGNISSCSNGSTDLFGGANNSTAYERTNTRIVSTATTNHPKNSLLSMPRGATTATTSSSLTSSFLARQVAVADTPDQFQKRRSHGIKGRSKTIAKVPTFGETLQF